MRSFTILLLFVATANAANWPAFLGQGADSEAIDPKAIPIQWSPESNVAWQAKLPGYGQSSPVVYGGKVFLTCVEGEMKDRCTVVALEMTTGEEVWRHSVESSDKVKSSNYVSRAAPTPVVDAKRLICFFESGDLVALNHDGEVLWQRSLSNEFGKFQNRFCIGASPTQNDDTVFVLVDHEGPSYLLAVNKADGQDLWKADRSSRMSWSSPAMIEVDGVPQLVISSAGSIDVYDPATGSVLWTRDDVGGNTAPTPTPAGDGLVLIGASPGPRGESTAIASKSNVLLRIGRQDGKFTAAEVWKAGKAMASFGSPIAYQGYGYWVNRAGVVFCFDIASGEEKYASRLDESCWATPIGIGDRIYFFGQTGKTTVIQAGPEFKKLATNTLWEAKDEAPSDGQPNFGGPTQYGVAAVDDALLVRTGEVLYCIKKTGRN